MVIAKDHDFVEWARSRTPRAHILWGRFGNMRRDSLQARMDQAWPMIEQALATPVTVIEVGR
ncbi:DUF5615 family PIN-like protein [Caulobacter sp. DWR1-3-2b1]|uniref:DUF5615 family PIN-like protein n=1 Tax=Caulobacter sp. DWR1-3-2b1 TaxID=2804670 RepID=UPI003CFA0982